MGEGLACEHCGTRIERYYHEGYRGHRGRCPGCGTDFPLE